MPDVIPSFIDKTRLPHKPGVYIFKDTSGKILYVGKAIDLYHRVASYFSGKYASPKIQVLVQKIAKCQTIEVSSELEALILEANLIKKYLPPYNIRLTDDKDYLYIKVTKEPFPKIITARKNDLSDAKEFFGPFPSAGSVRLTLKKLRRIFPWCSSPPRTVSTDRGLQSAAKKGRVRPLGFKYRPCFYYHLGLCPGPCAGKVIEKEYGAVIRMFIKFMEGKKEELKKQLEEEMDTCSKNLEFEKAASVKKIIDGMEYITQPTRVEAYLENPNFLEEQRLVALDDLRESLGLKKAPRRIECYDISNLVGKEAVGSLVVLTDGEIDKKWYRKFKIKISGRPNDFAMMAEMVKRRLKHNEWPMPDLILIDGGRGQVRAALKELSQKSWHVPIFGLAKRLEWLYLPDRVVIKLSHRSLGLRLLQKIRDEAHRFALSYHRKLRGASRIPA